jgi:hypothetical protein
MREMIVEVYGDNAMKKTAVYKCVTCFSEGRKSVTHEERSGWPTTSTTEENIAKVRQIVRENRWVPVRSREAVTKILTEDLDRRKVCAEMVPKGRTLSVREFLASKQITVLNTLPIHIHWI